MKDNSLFQKVEFSGQAKSSNLSIAIESTNYDPVEKCSNCTVSALSSDKQEANRLNIQAPSKRRSSFLGRLSVGGKSRGESITIDIGLDIKEENVKCEKDDVLYKRSNSRTACQVEDFIPLRVLGQGAYGKVLLVKNIHTGRLFAQKVLKKASIVMNKKNVERTMSERTILGKITEHQNIVKLFYALHDESKLYLLMEYIPGGELFQYLAKEKFLNMKSTSFYVCQMAMALKFLHNCGIVYRDLKPENCLLDKYGYLVLTDFGLAKQASDDDDKNDNWCNSIIGTPEYCAPEVLKGEEYGFMADWWSLGCVTFDLLTGNPPFTGNSHKVIMDKVIKQKPKYPMQVMAESKELLNKLLNKNVLKRLDVDNNWEKFEKMQFFRHFQFKDIEKRIVEPPLVPSITNLELAECFDEQFTRMKLSDLNVVTDAEGDSLFQGFSYTASNSFIDSYIT